MKRFLLISLLSLTAHFCAQDDCSPTALSQAAAQVLALQKELGQAQVGESDTDVPPLVADKITKLKDALVRAADAALACTKPSVDPTELQKDMVRVLHANQTEYDGNPNISRDDPRFVKLPGYYGHNLRVQVSRQSGAVGILEIQFSFDIECGDDNMLLAYGLRNGKWVQALRWQSPPLKSVSDAFGDFFLSTILLGPSALESGTPKWRIVVAHGTPWCTSRFSSFKIDVLTPGPDPASPKVLWHTERGYSRGDFDTRLKSSGSTFELRLNSPCMNADSYERHVIYRYSVDENQAVHRIEPIATNARGFVEEWLYSPWSESRDFSEADHAAELKEVHDQFDLPSNDSKYVSHSYGPVRACAAPGIFQVQIDSTLEKIVPGKPGGDSKPLPSRYFHVREVKDGYLMLSAPTMPDLTCAGANLMPAGGS